MKQSNGSLRYWPLAVVSVLVLVSGCTKKPEAKASPSTDAQTSAAPASPPPEAQAADSSQASGPVLDATQLAGNAKQAMADADAALRQKEYEKAVRTMLAIQQAQLNAQQAEAARQQMIALQRNLATAMANGDQNAAAAAQLLRAAHTH